MHSLSTDDHIHEMQMQPQSPITPLLHSLCIEIGNASDAAHIYLVIQGEDSTSTELIVLQTIVCKKVRKMLCANVHAAKSHVTSHP